MVMIMGLMIVISHGHVMMVMIVVIILVMMMVICHNAMMMMMMSGHSEADLSRGGCAQTQDCVEERGRGQDQGEEQPPSAQVTYVLCFTLGDTDIL